jgi:hypothetical protein
MRDILAEAEVVVAVFSNARGISPRGIIDRELAFADYKGVFAGDDKGLGRAAFSAEVIALSRLCI